MPIKRPGRRGRPPYPGQFTPAEARLLPMIAEGLTNAEIAVRMGVSVHTVHSQVASMLSKSGVDDRRKLPPAAPTDSGSPSHRIFPAVLLRWLTLGTAVGGAAAGIAVLALATYGMLSGDTEPLQGEAPAPLSAALTVAESPLQRALAARPLRLPDATAGCPADSRREIPAFASGLGSGPAFIAGLSGFRAGATLGPPYAGALEDKTFLVPEQEERASILVRGKRIDAPGDVAFSDAGTVSTELFVSDFNASSGPARVRVFGTIVAGDGCYAVQLDSERYSEVVVFLVASDAAHPGASRPPIAPTASELQARPLLALPDAGQACRVDTARTVNPAIGLAIGPGPAYFVGLDRWGLASELPPPYSAWRAAKTVFATRPPNAGPLVIRGWRVDAPGDVMFDRADVFGPSVVSDTPPNSNAGGWYNDVLTTLVPAPGCYAIQVDGAGFSEVMIFRADF